MAAGTRLTAPPTSPAGRSGSTCPSGCRPWPGRRRRNWSTSAVSGSFAPLLRASSRQMPRSLRIPVDREAELELAGIHRLVAVLHLPGLRPRPSRSPRPPPRRRGPARLPKCSASARPWTMPAMQIWFIILASWPEPTGPSKRQARGVAGDHRLDTGRKARHRRRTSPSAGPFSAPAWPAGNRSIDEGEAAALGLGVQFARHPRRKRWCDRRRRHPG